MKSLSLLLTFILALHATTNELHNALSRQCHLEHIQANNILSKFQTFVVELELSFSRARILPEYSELLTELSAPDIWLLLTRINPDLLKQLRMVRVAIDELKRKVHLSEKCLKWLDILLGDKKDKFYLSYFELLIRSLSATTDIKIAELSSKQMLSAISNFREKYLEREYLFLPRNEEQHEIYLHCFLIYTSLINLPIRNVIADTFNFSLYGFFPSEFINPTKSDDIPSIDMKFLRNFNVDPHRDFIFFDNQLQLRKSTNLSRVNESWNRVIRTMPDERVRRVYYDDQMDLAYNIRKTETMIHRFHTQSSTTAMQWNRKVLFNLCVAFELMESLVAYEGHHISMLKLKRKLHEILTRHAALQECN